MNSSLQNTGTLGNQSSFLRYTFPTDLSDVTDLLSGFLLLAVVSVNYLTMYPQSSKYWK